jgi:hypothetical protein
VSSRLEREGRLRGAMPSSFLVPSEDGPRTDTSHPVQRPALADLRAAA